MNTLRYTPEQVIQALELTAGLIAQAAEKLGCYPSTVRDYVQRFEVVSSALREIREAKLDMCEGAVIKMISNDKHPSHAASCFFYLKCHGKDRGWVERAEVHARIDITGSLELVHANDYSELSDEQLEAIARNELPQPDATH